MNPVPHSAFFIEAPIVQYRLNDFAHVTSIKHENGLLAISMTLAGERFSCDNRLLSINTMAYIQPRYTALKLRLKRTERIPIGPKTFYHTLCSGFSFKLYFPKPPQNTQMIDLVTDESESEWAYNQYGIVLDDSIRSKIKVRYRSVKSIKEISDWFKSSDDGRTPVITNQLFEDEKQKIKSARSLFMQLLIGHRLRFPDIITDEQQNHFLKMLERMKKTELDFLDNNTDEYRKFYSSIYKADSGCPPPPINFP